MDASKGDRHKEETGNYNLAQDVCHKGWVGFRGGMESRGAQVPYKRKLIEVALPLDAINQASARDRYIQSGHPNKLHLWWARRPLAAARAVLWASLVDDPSAHPERFPSEEDQAVERRRLFDILEQLVVWENSNDAQVLEKARVEIGRSCNGALPNVLDPFCGGGAIPLEARRLGLPAFGGDLNPVAVLVSKGLVEIPPRFAGLPPVNPDADAALKVGSWDRAQGLAEDVGYYGLWMRERAFERIGHLYPKVTLPTSEGGMQANVIAWIWARTVRSPDPAWSGHVPLVRSWVLRKGKRNKPVVWAEPIVNRSDQTVSYRVHQGGDPPKGTVERRGGICVATGSPISFDYIRKQGRKGLLNRAPIAVVAEGNLGRVYLPPVAPGDRLDSAWSPRIPLPERTLGFRVQRYGMVEWADLFTDRQLVALSTFSELLSELRPVVEQDARAADLVDDGIPLRDGGCGVTAFADAVITYLSFVIDRCSDIWANLVSWQPGGEKIGHVFERQALPMVWDYAETNPFSSFRGNWLGQLNLVRRTLHRLPATGYGEILQRHASARFGEVIDPVVCTDPPYYDNVPYADLSDFFYVWLRHNLANVWPEETATLLTPKAEELIANVHRAGSKESARIHFEGGMAVVFKQIADSQHSAYPATIFYAFKQQETKKEGIVSTGWEVFLQGLVDAGLQITATWPVRTEMGNRMRALGSAALASSVVIACRSRPGNATLATRREFLDALQSELPGRVRLLQDQAIAPVDMAQSAIGPGMEVFSRYARVVEADGGEMRVRTALALINESLEEVLSSEETEFDADTRWALTWYEQNGHDPGLYGDAETLSKAKNTSVAGVVEAGIAESQGGKVRLYTRSELDPEWDPVEDRRPTVWELTQHLVKRLDRSEVGAGDLLRKVGSGMGERAQRLAYLLYQIADSEGRAKDAVAYNGLIQAWHDIARHAAAEPTPVAQTLGGM